MWKTGRLKVVEAFSRSSSGEEIEPWKSIIMVYVVEERLRMGESF